MNFFQYLVLHFRHLVAAGLGLLLCACNTAFDGLEVLELQLVVYDFFVADGVDCAVHVGDVIVIEAPEHMDYGVGFADVGKELVAEAFALARSFHEAGYVDDFDSGGDHAAGLAHLHQAVEALVGHGDDPTFGSMVQNGKLADWALALERQLKRVDLPTLGSPTMPHCNDMVIFQFFLLLVIR